MVSPGSARMVHLHSPLLPSPQAPPLPPVLGDSPLGKSKLEMSPLEPLRVPPHVSSAVSHQREKGMGRGKGRADTWSLGYFKPVSQSSTWGKCDCKHEASVPVPSDKYKPEKGRCGSSTLNYTDRLNAILSTHSQVVKSTTESFFQHDCGDSWPHD